MPHVRLVLIVSLLGWESGYTDSVLLLRGVLRVHVYTCITAV